MIAVRAIASCRLAVIDFQRGLLTIGVARPGFRTLLATEANALRHACGRATEGQ